MKIKAGDIFPTNEGCQALVISYQNSRNVLVEFLDENKHRLTLEAFDLRRGELKNPFHPSVYGAGYLGDGDHKASLAGKLRPSYCSWRSVIERCYSKKNLARNPTYKGCLVHPSWLNFQVFADWYEKEPNSGNLGFDLDKDLRLGGNKVYGPDTCSFVPEQINTLLNNCGSSRGLLPQGVRASGKKFEAILRVKGNHTYLGVYETAAIAHEVYKKAKSDNVKSMAEQWRDHIHPEVYDYLKSWTLV